MEITITETLQAGTYTLVPQGGSEPAPTPTPPAGIPTMSGGELRWDNYRIIVQPGPDGHARFSFPAPPAPGRTFYLVCAHNKTPGLSPMSITTQRSGDEPVVITGNAGVEGDCPSTAPMYVSDNSTATADFAMELGASVYCDVHVSAS